LAGLHHVIDSRFNTVTSNLNYLKDLVDSFADESESCSIKFAKLIFSK